MPELPVAEPATIAALWREAAGGAEDRPAYLVLERGAWRAVGWWEAGARIETLAAGFLAAGIERGDRVAIICRTRVEWALCDLALGSIGAVVVPVYPTSSALDTVHVLADSGARMLVCEDGGQYAKLERARPELWSLSHVVGLESFAGADELLADVEERGRRLLEGRPDVIAEACARVQAQDLLTIVYTSGTTGPPKGCMLSHGNYREMVESICRVPGLIQAGDRAVLHLPLAHVFARLVEFVGVRLALTIAFCPDASGLPAALRAVRPTILPTVPRVFETVYRTISSRFASARGPRRQLLDWALAVGNEVSRRRQAGEALPRRLAAEHRLADRLVYSKVKARFGAELRVAISGGAPLAREIAEFFHRLDVLVLEGYGLTECTTVATVNWPERYRFGTVGLPAPGVEVRIADDGEILVRGATVFQGYWGNPEATRAVLAEDGWLRTGDVGWLDDEGFLTITDRKKDLIVTPSGQNVSPQNIENLLKTSPYVADALVIGDRRPDLGALLVLDWEEVHATAATDEEVRGLVQRVVADVNRKLGRDEQVRRFTVLERPFLAEEGEVTPTLKLRRRACEEHFRDEIERMYASIREAPGGAMPAEASLEE